jgi:hypothetical protein
MDLDSGSISNNTKPNFRNSAAGKKKSAFGDFRVAPSVSMSKKRPFRPIEKNIDIVVNLEAKHKP